MNIASRLRKADKISTVFNIIDIKTILGITNDKAIYNALAYALKTKGMYKILDGIYSYDRSYSKKELGNKYRTPSYISTYTILQDEGIVFQPYSSITLICNRSEKKDIDGQEYIYRKIKDQILLNPLGIYEKNGISIATKERAICDKLYLDGMEYFDNLESINWDMMVKLNSAVYSQNPSISKFISIHRK